MNTQQNDDEKFEKFLRQFRPRAPEPLLIEPLEHVGKRRMTFAVWAAAVAAMVVLAVVMFTIKHGFQEAGSPATVQNSAGGVEQITSQPPLTIASANAVLAQAPSVKAAVDQIAFKPESTRLPKGKYSALAVLSEEKIKL